MGCVALYNATIAEVAQSAICESVGRVGHGPTRRVKFVEVSETKQGGPVRIRRYLCFAVTAVMLFCGCCTEMKPHPDELTWDSDRMHRLEKEMMREYATRRRTFVPGDEKKSEATIKREILVAILRTAVERRELLRLAESCESIPPERERLAELLATSLVVYSCEGKGDRELLERSLISRCPRWIGIGPVEG